MVESNLAMGILLTLVIVNQILMPFIIAFWIALPISYIYILFCEGQDTMGYSTRDHIVYEQQKAVHARRRYDQWPN